MRALLSLLLLPLLTPNVRAVHVSASPKTCNWGDARIPGAGGLDGGACCFLPEEEYVKAGWQTYMDAYWHDDTVSQETVDAALAEEKRKWWVD